MNLTSMKTVRGSSTQLQLPLSSPCIAQGPILSPYQPHLGFENKGFWLLILDGPHIDHYRTVAFGNPKPFSLTFPIHMNSCQTPRSAVTLFFFFFFEQHCQGELGLCMHARLCINCHPFSLISLKFQHKNLSKYLATAQTAILSHLLCCAVHQLSKVFDGTKSFFTSRYICQDH